ncbi:tetratricopeptide repeat protein [Massilia sp. YMA4]|nr:tetratricopeptide repeat protein [Massilia sp. YMA4]
MQALKKAERARQNGLPEEDVGGTGDWGLEPLTDAPAARPTADAEVPAPTPAAGGLELSLEPLDAAPEPAAAVAPPAAAAAAAPARPAPPRPAAEPSIPLQPAAEAVHDPVPPQARHEPAKARAAAQRGRAGETAQPPRPDAGAARAAARARAAAATTRPGLDMARVRVAGLSGILLVLLGTFGYIYWRATSAPGPGAALPMVPMPPPSATGATGIVVAPAEPAGAGAAAVPATTPDPALAALTPPSAAPGAIPATAVAPVSAAAAAPAAVPAPAAAAAAAPVPAERRVARPRVLSGPTVSDDPAIRQAAQQDLAERVQQAERDQTVEATLAGAPAPAAPAAPATPAYAAAGAPAYVPANGAGADVRIARGNGPAIAPAVQAAYASFVAGDLAGARQQYEAALRQDPNNRDALLGSAAVAQRDNRAAQAAAIYARLLELDPHDPDALAALVALRPGDTARSEAKLRDILKGRPDAGPVLFALGNLYARQGRWPEAQQAYFRAFTAAPDNADYAFNLAVGLDRLNQGKLAAGYYERALALPGPAGFERTAVQRRLRELTSASAPLQPAAPSAPARPAGN